jgi:dTMP kinase
VTTRGRFITVEGQDGAGKTTSIRFIEKLIRNRNIELLVTREPGGTKLGEELRRIILEGHEFHIDSMAELLIIFAARAQHLSETIRPALCSGAWVLCDRFTDATFAYQCGGRGLPRAGIESLETLVQEDLRPDLTLLLDIDIETGGKRANQRRQAEADRFESEETGFKSRVRETYLDLARSSPDRIQVVDGSLPLELVEEKISYILYRFIDNNGGEQ